MDQGKHVIITFRMPSKLDDGMSYKATWGQCRCYYAFQPQRRSYAATILFSCFIYYSNNAPFPSIDTRSRLVVRGTLLYSTTTNQGTLGLRQASRVALPRTEGCYYIVSPSFGKHDSKYGRKGGGAECNLAAFIDHTDRHDVLPLSEHKLNSGN